MRVFLLRMVAAKNSRKRRAAWSPASAIDRRHDDAGRGRGDGCRRPATVSWRPDLVIALGHGFSVT